MPPDYGAGAGYVIRILVEEPHRKHTLAVEGLLWGDIERARTEWISLLQQIAGSPEHPWPRWQALRERARQMTQKMPTANVLDLPDLLHEQQQPMEHRLR